MFKLSQKAIDEFRQIWKRQFGEDLSDELAESKGIELLKFMKLIYKPIRKVSKYNFSL